MAFLPNVSDGSPSDTIDANGVDRAQIREMLRLSPEQRLQRVQEFVESMHHIRELNEKRPLR